MRRLLMLIVRMYQVVVSPHIGNCCRYYPSCSNYSITAIETHGCLKGLMLSVWRLLRCNPFSHGGVDLVPGTEESTAI
jgi:putative membrane protein insertion efficiency factor